MVSYVILKTGLTPIFVNTVDSSPSYSHTCKSSNKFVPNKPSLRKADMVVYCSFSFNFCFDFQGTKLC